MTTPTILSLLLFLTACTPDVATQVDRYAHHAEAVKEASADLVQDASRATRLGQVDNAHDRYHRRLRRHLDAMEGILAEFDACTIPKEEAWTLLEASTCIHDLRVAQVGLESAHARHVETAQCVEAVLRHHKVVVVIVEDLLAPTATWEATLECDPEPIPRAPTDSGTW